MKSERRKLYPKNWEQLARQCKEQAGKRCQFCRIRQGRKRKSKRTGERYPVYLHAAHADHDIGNPNPVLLCLCPIMPDLPRTYGMATPDEGTTDQP